LMPILYQIAESQVMLLDRWQVNCRDLVDSTASLPTESVFTRAISPSRTRANTDAHIADRNGRKEVAICNYFGVGVDAAISLDFHEMRQWRPDLFVSRVLNKIWYFGSGTKNTFFKNCSDIASKIELVCDDRQIDIPAGMEGVIVLNIASYGGGARLWSTRRGEHGEGDEEESGDDDVGRNETIQSLDSSGSARFTVPSMEDKKLEVVCVHGSFQLGAAQIGLYKAKRLCQASTVRIHTQADLPVQADGEPWRFKRNGEIEITHKGQALMLGNIPEGSQMPATEIVEWGLQTRVLDRQQHQKLMTEIGKRAQRK